MQTMQQQRAAFALAGVKKAKEQLIEEKNKENTRAMFPLFLL